MELVVHGVLFENFFRLVVGSNSKLDERPHCSSEVTFSIGSAKSVKLSFLGLEHHRGLNYDADYYSKFVLMISMY